MHSAGFRGAMGGPAHRQRAGPPATGPVPAVRTRVGLRCGGGPPSAPDRRDLQVPIGGHDSGQQQKPHLVQALLEVLPSGQDVRDQLHPGERPDPEAGKSLGLDAVEEIALGGGAFGQRLVRLDPARYGSAGPATALNSKVSRIPARTMGSCTIWSPIS